MEEYPGQYDMEHIFEREPEMDVMENYRQGGVVFNTNLDRIDAPEAIGQYGSNINLVRINRPNMEERVIDERLPERHIMKLHPVYRVGYRVINQRQFSENLQNANYTASQPMQNLNSPDIGIVPSVISKDLMSCLDITNIKHEFNGKLHAIAVTSLDRYETCTLYFKIMTIHNSTFASLTISAQSFDHMFRQDGFVLANQIVRFRAFLSTGALGGYNIELLDARFREFTLYIATSAGRMDAGENTGVRFYKVLLGPYKMEELLTNETEVFNRLGEKVVDDFHRRVEELMNKEYDDNADITNFADLLSMANGKALIADSRIDDVTIKLLPKAIYHNPRLPIVDPSHFRPAFIEQNDNDELPNPIINFTGDAPNYKINPDKHLGNPSERLDGVDEELLDRTLKSGLIQNRAGLMPDYTPSTSIVEEGKLSRDIERLYVAPEGETLRGKSLDWYMRVDDKYGYFGLDNPSDQKESERILINSELIDEIGPRDTALLYYADRVEGEGMPPLELLPPEMMEYNPDAEGEAQQERFIDYEKAHHEKDPAKKFQRTIERIRREMNSGRLTEKQIKKRLKKLKSLERDRSKVLGMELVEAQDRKRREEEELENERGRRRRLGCIIGKDKLEKAIGRLSQLWSPPEINDNNCLLRCINKFLEKEGEVDFVEQRLIYDITHQREITMYEADRISKHHKLIIKLWHIVATPYNEKSLALQKDAEESRISHIFTPYITIYQDGLNDPDQSIVHLLYHKSHCYLMTDVQVIVKKVKCSLCAQWINRSTFCKHILSCKYCTKCRKAYHSEKHSCGPNDRRLTPSENNTRKLALSEDTVATEWIPMKPEAPGKKITASSKIYFADIEAFPDPEKENRFIPYAIGLMRLDEREQKNPKIFYGRNCMEEYLQYLAVCNGTLYYFNGSGFDNYLHIKGMVDHNYHIDSGGFIKNGSRIMAFNQHSKLKVRDLCLFIKSKLDDACKDWGVPVDESKKQFDHERVYDWESVEKVKDEVIEYLNYDVISLASLFKIYHTTMWQCFSKDMNLCVSPAQFSLQAWSSKCPLLHEIFIPHHGKEEDDDRAAYYGGRVMCQRKEFISKDFIDEHLAKYDQFEKVRNYLVCGDVNSLYPAVQMKNEFAHGKWHYCTPSFEGEYVATINNLLNTEWMGRCCFKVDVQCPKDLLTAFLMERNKDGSITHTLHDKYECWYWGSELEEAIILGYQVTKVHQIKQYEKKSPLFKDFVTTCWEGRKTSNSGSAKNLSFKFAMNGLTGKFGQKAHLVNTVIYNTSYQPNKKTENRFNDMISRVIDFEPIFTEEGDNSAIIIEVKNANINPNYPVYLSAQILAYARVYMSQIMRCCNAYHSPEHSIYYTDTDSLVIPPSCIPLLDAGGYIGKELGQLKCDLNSNFRSVNDFAKIVKGIWAATKGPYSLVYLLPEPNSEVMEKVKMKGIPHSDKPHPYFNNIKIVPTAKEENIIATMDRWLKEPTKYNLPGFVIGKQFFIYHNPKSEVMYAVTHVNFRVIRDIMNDEGHVYAFYGTMKKSFTNYDGQLLMIRPDVVRRMLCRTDWWSKNKRVFEEEGNEESLTYPPGYEL